METNKTARLLQPVGSITSKHAAAPSTGGTARSVSTTRTIRRGTALAAMVCSLAVSATAIAPMASGSTLRRDASRATDNVVNEALGHLQEIGGIRAGTVLGMENFLRVFPATAAVQTIHQRATNNLVNAELGHLQETGGIAAGTVLGMENFLRVFPPR